MNVSRGTLWGALATALAALAIGAAPAAATDFPVDSTGEGVDVSTDGICDADAGIGVACTLRAALQESNATVTADTITFQTSPFNGELANDTIDLASALPPISQPVTIACQVSTAPCAGVDSPGGVGDNVFTVNADNVTIRDVAITNALTGISVFEPTASGTITGFSLKDAWIGVKLDGATAGPFNTGLFMDGSVQGATIGGPNTTAGLPDRNVIANNNVSGLLIQGGDEATIQGNYFGVRPDGSTQAANAVNIRIGAKTNPDPDDAATGNNIGGGLSLAQQNSAGATARAT